MSLASIRKATVRLAQVSALAISLAGATAFGGALPVLYAWNPELAETLPATSTFTRASTSQVLTTTDGTTFWYQEAKSGEVRQDGNRRVEQRLIGSHDFANAAWTASNITVNGGTELVASGATPNISQAIASLPIGEYIFAIKVSLTSGSIGADGDVSIDFEGTSLDIGSEITGSPQVIQVRHTEATGGSLTATLNIASGLTLEVAFGHVEYVGGRTTDVFGAEVDDSVEYLNVGVNGVLYLNTDQANTAAGTGVVTEATGTTITGGGYLPEPAATNQMDESSDFSTWPGTGIGLTDLGIVDISLNAYTFDTGTGNSVHRLLESALSGGAGSCYTIAKARTGRYLTLRRGGNPAIGYAVFDLQTGTITEEGSQINEAIITDLGNGWYKCELNTPATSVSMHIGISNTGTPGTGDPSYTGVNETIDVSHAQYETTDFSTSPIITSGSTVTRVADVLTGPSWTSEHSAVFDVTKDSVGAAAVIVGYASSTGHIFYFASNFQLLYLGQSSMLATVFGTYTGLRQKVAFSAKTAEAIVVDDQGQADTDTTGTPGTGAMSIGSANGINQLRGRIHSVTAYAVSRTEAQLEALVA